MYCAKCGYTSFDHTANCTKCGYDWKKEKDALNLGWISGAGFDWLNQPMPAASRAEAGFSFDPVASDADSVAEIDLGAKGPSGDTLDLDVPTVPDVPPFRRAPGTLDSQAKAAHQRQSSPPVNTELSVDGLEELLVQDRPNVVSKAVPAPDARNADPVSDLPDISLELEEPDAPKPVAPKPAGLRAAQAAPAKDDSGIRVVQDSGTTARPEPILDDSGSGIELELDFSSLEPEPLPVTRHPDASGKELILDLPEDLDWELEEEEPAPAKKS